MMGLDARLRSMLHRRAAARSRDGERVSIMSNGLQEGGRQGMRSNETDWMELLPEGSLTRFILEMAMRCIECSLQII